MTLPKASALGLIILAAFLIISFILGKMYLQNNNTPQDTPAISPTSIVPSVIELSPTEAPGNAGIANPASVYCQEQGGKSEIITAPDGSQGGQCVFSDGRKCDEWQFFRTKACN